MTKTLSIFSGASFILTLNSVFQYAISVNYGHEFRRNRLLQEFHQTLNYGFDIQFV